MMTWTGRVVTDTRGDHPRRWGPAYENLKDWLLDYYDIDVEIAVAYEN